MPAIEKRKQPQTSGVAYSAWHAALDAAALLLFTAGVIYLLIDTLAARNIPGGIVLLVIALTAYLAADLVSGIVHFLADNFGNAETPLVGRMFVFPFREHHNDPLAITRHSFLETNGASCLVALPLLFATIAFTDGAEQAALRLWIFSFLLAVFFTNQIHKWAHMVNPPRAVRFLQSCRLILSPRSHAIHHTAPHDSYYCITAGWLNLPLARSGVFSHIARLLGKDHDRKQ
ncbi:MAG: fatty acid desaturase CarF family protein [Turneriella sp.]